MILSTMFYPKGSYNVKSLSWKPVVFEVLSITFLPLNRSFTISESGVICEAPASYTPGGDGASVAGRCLNLVVVHKVLLLVTNATLGWLNSSIVDNSCTF